MGECASPCLKETWGFAFQELGASGRTPDTTGIEGLHRECNRGVMRAIYRWQCDGELRNHKILDADLTTLTSLAHLAGLGCGGCVVAAIMIHGSHVLLVCAHAHHFLLHGARRRGQAHTGHSLKGNHHGQEKGEDQARLHTSHYRQNRQGRAKSSRMGVRAGSHPANWTWKESPFIHSAFNGVHVQRERRRAV